jgi:hypothetical protein
MRILLPGQENDDEVFFSDFIDPSKLPSPTVSATEIKLTESVDISSSDSLVLLLQLLQDVRLEYRLMDMEVELKDLQLQLREMKKAMGRVYLAEKKRLSEDVKKYLDSVEQSCNLVLSDD